MSDTAREIDASTRRIHTLAVIRNTFRTSEALDALRAFEREVVEEAHLEQRLGGSPALKRTTA
jgi:hypothetical protein